MSETPETLLPQHSAQAYYALMENISDGFVALDAHWRILFINEEGARILQRKPQALIGRIVWEEFPEAVGSRFWREYHRAADERISLQFEEYYSPLNTWFEMRVFPADGGGIFLFYLDINRRKQVEDYKEQNVLRNHIFLRDICAGLTGGKLRLCVVPEELPTPLPLRHAMIPLSMEFGLRELRFLTQEAMEEFRFPEERQWDMVTAVGEAALNAVVHAGTGMGTICATPFETVQVWIEDQGDEIGLDRMQQAALAHGYNTKALHGYGYQLMSRTADRVFLLTGPGGTTVVLEKDCIAASPFL